MFPGIRPLHTKIKPPAHPRRTLPCCLSRSKLLFSPGKSTVWRTSQPAEKSRDVRGNERNDAAVRNVSRKVRPTQTPILRQMQTVLARIRMPVIRKQLQELAAKRDTAAGQATSAFDSASASLTGTTTFPDNFDPMTFLKGMLSPEQQAMFEAFRDGL